MTKREPPSGIPFEEAPHRPFEDAISVFENGHGLIRAYKKKYGYSYRRAIRVALRSCQKRLDTKK